MSTCERRKGILQELQKSDKAISATVLADKFGVSRQIIVGDVAILRAESNNIVSTTRGYIIAKSNSIKKKIKVSHGKELVKEELYAIVDNGGRVLDVIVEHPIYGIIKVDLQLSSRLEVDKFVYDMKEKDNTPLSILTNSEHTHTIETDDEEKMYYIEKKLGDLGILI